MLIKKAKGLSTGMLLSGYTLIREATIAMGVTLGGHPQFVRPLIYPMAEGASIAKYGNLDKNDIDKIKGLSYEEIAKRGGGILNSAKRLQQASEEELYEDAMQRLEEIKSYGTGAVEIKSGYGLTTEAELKMLRVIRKLKENSPLTIKANFLGAHGVPMEYRGKQGEFVDLVINEMIPRVVEEGLADFIDVFCDTGFFTVEETDRMLFAGVKNGLIPKIHANELDYSGGIQVGVKYNALSVDHLECVGEAEIQCLKASQTMPTILPGAAFFLNMPYSPARTMINAGLPVAINICCHVNRHSVREV